MIVSNGQIVVYFNKENPIKIKSICALAFKSNMSVQFFFTSRQMNKNDPVIKKKYA